MKSKFAIVLIIFTIFLLPNKTLSQNINFELKNIVPEELRILKEEYSSIIIGVYMRTQSEYGNKIKYTYF